MRPPSKMERALLGAVPGVRLMALEDFRRGLPSVVLGLALALAVGLILAGWHASSAALNRLRILPSVELFDLLAVVALATAYELLRLAHDAVEEPRRTSIAARSIAALLLPTASVTVLLPMVVYHAPRYLEAMWGACALMAHGALPAAAWCVFENTNGLARGSGRRRQFALVAGLFLMWPLIALMGVRGLGLGEDLGEMLSEMGFVVFPRVLSP